MVHNDTSTKIWVIIDDTSYCDSRKGTVCSTEPYTELTTNSTSTTITYYNTRPIDNSEYIESYYDRLKEIKQGWKCPVKIGNIMASKYKYKNLNIRDKLHRNKIRVNEQPINN
jgi:hypothetical protein